MKKKYVLYGLIPLACIVGAFVYFSNVLPKGDTVESREVLLDNAIPSGDDWTITKEIENINFQHLPIEIIRILLLEEPL